MSVRYPPSSASQVSQGYLCIVLHAHLPFVRHPENPYMLEENWLFEAMAECYLPLLVHLTALADDGIPFRLTLSLSPTLCTMLADGLLQDRFAAYLDKRIELAEKEVRRTARRGDYSQNARMYRERFRSCRWFYEDVFRRDLLGAFGRLQEAGVLEIITCGATHAFLPNLQHTPRAAAAQISVAVGEYRRFFGRAPAGMWLPECGYFPGLEEMLAKEGVRYFFVDTHGILFADPRPHYGVFAPLVCESAAVAAFGRDADSSRSVWSASEGYPGHPSYRDFYRDIGFDLDFDYVKPYVDPIGTRVSTGIKYYRITDRRQAEKRPYRRKPALCTADRHAADFLEKKIGQVAALAPLMDRPPLVVAPYDAELFGHWWYEGPEWLNFLIRKAAFEQDSLLLVTPSDYLARHEKNQRARPSLSSWGEGGFSGVWLDESNDWICAPLSRMEMRMASAATIHADAYGVLGRTLNQMSRELLLAQASDWAFIMKSGTTVDYAVRRTREHIANFHSLYEQVAANAVDESLLARLESTHAIFPEIDYRVFRD